MSVCAFAAASSLTLFAAHDNNLADFPRFKGSLTCFLSHIITAKTPNFNHRKRAVTRPFIIFQKTSFPNSSA